MARLASGDVRNCYEVCQIGFMRPPSFENMTPGIRRWFGLHGENMEPRNTKDVWLQGGNTVQNLFTEKGKI